MAIDRGLVAANLIGSLLSILGTSFILICYIVLPQQRHIRHALITNLTIADFINAVNNSASGLYVAASGRPLTASPACTANGFIGQLSVQAVDCSILITTIFTCWIVTSSKSVTEFSLLQIAILCSASWILPIITSFVALGLGIYSPASSNWCWIQEKPTYLRYLLTHGWRFVIIAIVCCLCVYIQVHIRRHYRSMTDTPREIGPFTVSTKNNVYRKKKGRNESNAGSEGAFATGDEEEMMAIVHQGTEGAKGNDQQDGSNPPVPPKKGSISGNYLTLFKSRKMSRSDESKNHAKSAKEKQIQRAMLLHAYPLAYIILWIPGIAMRIVQATGGKSYALSVMQASTQFIGFANALTFGWNEGIGKQLRDRFY